MADASRREERLKRQRMAALEQSKKHRAKRKELRAQVRSGEVDPFDLIAGRLDEWEDDVGRWRLEQLLKVIPGVGPVTAHEVIEAFIASPRMKVRGLSFERREQLADLLAEALGRPRVG